MRFMLLAIYMFFGSGSICRIAFLAYQKLSKDNAALKKSFRMILDSANGDDQLTHALLFDKEAGLRHGLKLAPFIRYFASMNPISLGDNVDDNNPVSIIRAHYEEMTRLSKLQSEPFSYPMLVTNRDNAFILAKACRVASHLFDLSKADMTFVTAIGEISYNCFSWNRVNHALNRGVIQRSVTAEKNNVRNNKIRHPRVECSNNHVSLLTSENSLIESIRSAVCKPVSVADLGCEALFNRDEIHNVLESVSKLRAAITCNVHNFPNLFELIKNYDLKRYPAHLQRFLKLQMLGQSYYFLSQIRIISMFKVYNQLPLLISHLGDIYDAANLSEFLDQHLITSIQIEQAPHWGSHMFSFKPMEFPPFLMHLRQRLLDQIGFKEFSNVVWCTSKLFSRLNDLIFSTLYEEMDSLEVNNYLHSPLFSPVYPCRERIKYMRELNVFLNRVFLLGIHASSFAEQILLFTENTFRLKSVLGMHSLIVSCTFDNAANCLLSIDTETCHYFKSLFSFYMWVKYFAADKISACEFDPLHELTIELNRQLSSARLFGTDSATIMHCI